MTGTVTLRALVVGLGTSGVAAATLLAHQGHRVTVNDRRSAAELADAVARLPVGVTTSLGGHPSSLLENTDLVVASPGVRWDLPLLADARRRGIETIAEVELAARSMGSTPIAGVTGSNGKSTVTSLLGEIAREAGLRTAVGGNLGTAACELALAGGWDVAVLELSSFQLEGCTSLRPRVALLLNLSPDHLDRHPSLDAYLAAKVRIFAFQQESDAAILNADDPVLSGVATRSRIAHFSLLDAHAEAHLARGVLVLDGEPLLPRSDLPLPGDHNVANALAAALGASRLGIPRGAIASGLGKFRGLPHRHWVVAEASGVVWVDDSKGTNVGATAAGLAGYAPGTVHLILGGLGKGQDFRELRPATEGRLARIYLIGEAAREIGAALDGVAPLEWCGTLDEAVRRAAHRARPGDTVLLSPACASFDQFRDYAHRGDEFARLARLSAGGA
ncbi:MAG TPA: UDP-N-acetylmuramoyl-L-alanine--D-glutamate ligase [Thermoanaerobaculaceae bacterium]|nr:UDP-N-acetylmuramoyl-L-alanine--D-glutamate ligase [Thermoanaerobaculaceae bacterium]